MKSPITLMLTLLFIWIVDINYSPRYKLMISNSGKCYLNEKLGSKKYYFTEADRALEHQPDRLVIEGYGVQGVLSKNLKSNSYFYLDDNVIIDDFYFERSPGFFESLVGSQDAVIYIVHVDGKKYLLMDGIVICLNY
jgi:hypothetical protein